LIYFGRPGLGKLRFPSSEDLKIIKDGWGLARRIINAGEHGEGTKKAGPEPCLGSSWLLM
jgi:hypothetical protein